MLNREATGRPVNKMYKIRPGGGRPARIAAPKGKNLQELYIAATSIRLRNYWENLRMDVIYLLILVGLYLTTHGLVRALGRLGKTL
jgi:hypothetical protein